MGKATQKGRLLSITTPLGEDHFLIDSLKGREAISELYEFDVKLLYDEDDDDDFELTRVDVSKILGQAVNVSIAQDEMHKRNYAGIIRQLSELGRDHHFSIYSAKIVPNVWKLTQTSQSRIFQHITVPDILAQVLEGFEFRMQVRREYKQRNFCVQYQETDYDFISRLMEEEGIYFYFDHSDGREKMVIRDDYSTPEEMQGVASVPVYKQDDKGKNHWNPSISEFKEQHTLKSGKITYWDYNFELPSKKLETSTVSRFSRGGNQEMEIFKFPGGYAGRYDAIDKTGSEQSSNLDQIFKDNKTVAKNEMLQLDSGNRILSGHSTSSVLTPGYRFTAKSHPNKEFNISYIVVSVETDADQFPNYYAGEGSDRPYSNTFTCIPHGEGTPEYRPKQKTQKPQMIGAQTAFVVGPAGEEIYTDKYGRVKIQFHWDRNGKADANSACWVRVAKDLAGNKYGSMFIPRIGQEVIVDFIGGDPDQPIVTGSVYNPETMPHYELPKYKTLSYIKTRTTPDDGKGFNELRFEDKKGKEQVFIHSQKRADIRVRGSFYETCGGNRQERIGVRSDNQPGGNLTITVGGSHDFHVQGNEFIGIDGKRNDGVKGDVVESFSGALSTLVTAKAELNAREITLEAVSKISLKVGGNCIVIDQSGITIAGTMAKINSGGFAAGTSDPVFMDPLDADSADTGEPGFLDRPRSGGGSGRNTRRLRSQHYIAPPRPGEDARITAMRGTLADSEQGRHALEVYDRYGVSSSFKPGEGSTYNGDSNNMNLDPSEDPTTSALTFTHEMNHAESNREGRSGDVQNQSRNDFVETMLDEEVEGSVRSIEARNELAENGHDVSGSHFPLENEYQQAYDNAASQARSNNPNMSEAEVNEIARQAGRDRVRQGFDNGEVVTSNTNDKYGEYYGNSWDANHPGTP